MAESVDLDVESIEASPNALIDAVKGGLISSINDVQRVIGQDRAVDINKADEAFGFTALHWAVVNSSTMHSIVIEALIESGADIEAKCKKLKTPLIWAAEMGQAGIFSQHIILVPKYFHKKEGFFGGGWFSYVVEGGSRKMWNNELCDHMFFEFDLLNL